MSIASATPYLILCGRALEALEVYERALGARVETVQRFGEVDQSCPEARRDNIMHAALRIGDALLMLSDGPSREPEAAQRDPLSQGTRVSVALDFTTPTELRSSFEKLRERGEVIEPVFDAPWGALFGVVQDRFGVHWMLNCTHSTAAA